MWCWSCKDSSSPFVDRIATLSHHRSSSNSWSAVAYIEERGRVGNYAAELSLALRYSPNDTRLGRCQDQS